MCVNHLCEYRQNFYDFCRFKKNKKKTCLAPSDPDKETNNTNNNSNNNVARIIKKVII